MTLKSYFPEQFQQIEAFMVSGTEVVHCVRIDPEMKPMLTKVLAKMEDDAEFPHAFIGYTEPFTHPVQYFENLFDVLTRQFAQNAEALKEQNLKFAVSFDEKSPPPSPLKFLRCAEVMAEGMPDQVGSLVFLLDPDEIVDADGFCRSVRFLTEKTNSRWLKFIVFDLRTLPVIEEPAEADPRIGFQTFHLSPEEIERRVKEDLASPGALQPAERRQYIGMLAGFAFARKGYRDAEKLQRQWAEEAEREGSAQELAAALYNLGNTLIAKGDHDQAVDVYCRTCDLCIDQGINSLAPLTYTNLGIALHRKGDFPQAFAALKVARDLFKAQNVRPGEAYVVDCLAQMYADDGQNQEAERAWHYVLSLYDGVSSGMFKDVRDVGSSGIIGKLERHYEQTGQADKLAALKAEGIGSHVRGPSG